MIARAFTGAAFVVVWRARLPLFIFAMEFLVGFGEWLEHRRVGR